MKRIVTIITVLIAVCDALMAQPAAVKNAAKSVFTLTTFKADGNLLASGHGVFIGADGEAISNLTPFIGAASAVVIDARGNKMNVTRMLGANSIYDVAKFKVDGKTVAASVASSAASAGTQVWLVPYSVKTPAVKSATVRNVETFMDKYSYYIFTLDTPDNTVACPFVNARGEVIGLLQPSTTNNDIHATDARYAADFKVSALSANEDIFRKISVPTALPDDKEQAVLALMIIGHNGDSLKHAAAVDDFLKSYPEQLDGYVAKAQIAVGANKFDDAAMNMEKAIKSVANKDEAHFNYSKIIYDKELYNPAPYASWSLDKALDEAEKAYSINPLPVYRHQQALVKFSKGEYQQAYDMFMALAGTSLRNSELYYEAARCKQMMKAPNTEVLALLDSAVNNTDTMRITEAAPYFLARAEVYVEEGNYRQAVFDYTRYELLKDRRQLGADFYYVREQAEVKAKLFKQALIDINMAVILAPKEPLYLAEKASLELRVNMVDDALETARHCVELAPEYSDGYLLLGLAQVQNGNKAEGLENMKKAKELGNEQAEKLIGKYSK